MPIRRTRTTKGRRGLRVGNIIRQIVSEELVMRLNDPRLAFVTVTAVEVAADLRFADVRISILGDEKQQKDCLRAVKHAHGHIQEKVAAAMTMKFCPVLRFHMDPSVKQSVTMSALIAQARAEDEARRADRIARGVEEAPLDETPMEETEPVLDKVEEEDPDEDLDEEFEDDEDVGDEDVADDDDEEEEDEEGDDEEDA
jgi:ribosome-binding factor A